MRGFRKDGDPSYRFSDGRGMAGSEGLGRRGAQQRLPEARRGAYTTAQTVLNRLVDRGLVSRRREGRAFRYSATITEADYV